MSLIDGGKRILKLKAELKELNARIKELQAEKDQLDSDAMEHMAEMDSEKGEFGRVSFRITEQVMPSEVDWEVVDAYAQETGHFSIRVNQLRLEDYRGLLVSDPELAERMAKPYTKRRLLVKQV